MTDLWDDSQPSRNSDKSMDEDMHLDQPIKEEKTISPDPDMIQMLWMSTPSLLVLMC